MTDTFEPYATPEDAEQARLEHEQAEASDPATPPFDAYISAAEEIKAVIEMLVDDGWEEAGYNSRDEFNLTLSVLTQVVDDLTDPEARS